MNIGSLAGAGCPTVKNMGYGCRIRKVTENNLL
jgi:hypothetical protein